MGSAHRGSKRPTSMRNRRLQVSNLLISALKIPATATSSPKQAALSKFNKYPMSLIIQYLVTLFPHLAPFIYAAFLAYKLGETLIFATKEYLELRKRMETEEALIVESKRFVIREGLRYLSDNILFKDVRDRINNNIADLVTSKSFQEMILKVVGKDQRKREILQSMIAATMSQFIEGALSGRTTDELVMEAAKILVE